MAVTSDGTPYVEPGDAISAYPVVSQELAAVIDSLRTMIPAGAIFPYAGKIAPEGYLLCDGKAYKRGDFFALYNVMSEWAGQWGGFPNGDTSLFFVPDMRGRSPVGQQSLNDAVVGYSTALGQRQGDWRTKAHRHVVTDSGFASKGGLGPRNVGTPEEWDGYSGMPLVSSDTPEESTAKHEVRKINVPSGADVNPPNDANRVWFAYEKSDYVADDRAAHGTSHLQPQTVVNFIVWTGTTTAGKNPEPGVELSPVTTRMMIEARLEEAGIGEEEIEQLRELLATLKENTDG